MFWKIKGKGKKILSFWSLQFIHTHTHTHTLVCTYTHCAHVRVCVCLLICSDVYVGVYTHVWACWWRSVFNIRCFPLICTYVHRWFVCIAHLCECVKFSGTGVTDSWELPCACSYWTQTSSVVLGHWTVSSMELLVCPPSWLWDYTRIPIPSKHWGSKLKSARFHSKHFNLALSPAPASMALKVYIYPHTTKILKNSTI